MQLYSSTNRGAAWQLYGKVEPAKGRFLFHAPADGEYWFSVSTVDRFGQAPAAAPSTPGLIVFVDTVVPKLQITARRGPTGETIVHWQVDELHPKSGSLVLQYRGAPTMPWQSIRFDRPEPGAAGPVASGEVTLYPPADVAQLELRGEVLDMAGNAGVGQAKIELREPGAARVAAARVARHRRAAHGHRHTADARAPGRQRRAATAAGPASG